MKSRTFAVFMVAAFWAAALFLGALLFFADKKWCGDWKKGEIAGGEVIFREAKTQFISQKDVPYNAYILGGSKAGFLKPATFDLYSGKHFYNFYTDVGLFSNYERFSNYIIDRQGKNAQEILIHLSTYETNGYDDAVYVPYEMQANIFLKAKSRLQFFKEKYLNSGYFNNLRNFHRIQKSNIEPSGEINSSECEQKSAQNPEKFVETYVLNNFQVNLKKLFYEEPHLRFCKKDIEALKRIKRRCDENGTKLTVVIGAHFISAYADEFGSDFDAYLRDLVSVAGEVWTFCGFCGENRNPYNFVNAGHFWKFVGDKMIETMYSPEPNTRDMDSFGILLNADNIDEYIESQKQKWLALKAEYDATGTITLLGKSDASYLGE